MTAEAGDLLRRRLRASYGARFRFDEVVGVAERRAVQDAKRNKVTADSGGKCDKLGIRPPEHRRPMGAIAMAEPTESKPLSERPRDWFFVLAFSFFAFSSFFSDAWHALGLLEGDAFWARANRWYIETAQDYFLTEDHLYARINTGISGLVYGPFYVVLVYAFVKGRNWIQPLALLYVGAMLHGMVEFLAWEFWIGPPPGRPLVFWAFYGPYAAVPLLLAVRMWRPRPFASFP